MTTNLYPAAEPTLYDVIDAMQSGFARVENQFITLQAQIEALTSEVRQGQRRQTKFEYLLENIDDTVLNHEERITVLEKR